MTPDAPDRPPHSPEQVRDDKIDSIRFWTAALFRAAEHGLPTIVHEEQIAKLERDLDAVEAEIAERNRR
jgi:hypothetical protein